MQSGKVPAAENLMDADEESERRSLNGNTDSSIRSS
jgi:hypothetical protein